MTFDALRLAGYCLIATALLLIGSVYWRIGK